MSTPTPTSDSDRLPSDETTAVGGLSRTLARLLAVGAGVCWLGILVLLLLVELRVASGPFALLRLLFVLLALMAGLLTFVPAQQQLHLPRLALEGTLGTTLLLYTLAFVPPPGAWLLSLPDVPVYALLIVAVFWSATAMVLPFVSVFRQRFVRQRTRRRDVRLARRQSQEIGLLVAGVVVLAALDVLTWISFLLVLVILVILELLLLSRDKA